MVEAALTSDGPMGVGSTYRFVVKAMGQQFETRGQVTEYEPPKWYAWRGTKGPFPLSGDVRGESAEGGTRVTSTINAEPGGFFKLAEPLLMRQQQSQMEHDLKTLKALLEAQA